MNTLIISRVKYRRYIYKGQLFKFLESHTKNKLQHFNSSADVYIEFWLLFSKSLSTDKNTKSLLFRTQNQQGGPNVILGCDTIIFIPIRNIFGHFTLDFALILPFKIEINIPASNMPRIKKNTNFHDFKNWRCTLDMHCSDISLWKYIVCSFDSSSRVVFFLFQKVNKSQ